MFLGFAGEGYRLEEQVLLTPGQQVEVGPIRCAARGG